MATRVFVCLLQLSLIALIQCSATGKGIHAGASSASVEGAGSQGVQRVAQDVLATVISGWDPSLAFIAVLDPVTGNELAVLGHEDGRDDPTVVSRRALVPGSTFKAFTVAAALDQRTIDPEARVDCKARTYGLETLSDTPREICAGPLTVGGVLTLSSNVGASHVFDTMGLGRFLPYVRALHLGEAPARIPPLTDDKSIEAATFAAGDLTTATTTPLQLAAAYAAIFNDGVYSFPTAGNAPVKHTRVFRATTAQTVVQMLEACVADENGTGKLARLAGHRVAGKTGTAEVDGGHGAAKATYCTFVGTVLNHTPRFVALVGLVDPRQQCSGPTAAAPAFSRLAARIVDMDGGERWTPARRNSR